MQTLQPPPPRAIRPRTENHYCPRCMRTQRFVDRGPTLHCHYCDRQLWKRPAA